MTSRNLGSWLLGLGGLIVVLAVSSSTAQAQDYYDRPVVSPYLNLLQGPNQFGIISTPYQTQVRPQLELERQGQQLNNLQNQTQQLQNRQSGASYSAGSRSSGHRGVDGSDSRYLNYSHYYPNLNARFRR